MSEEIGKRIKAAREKRHWSQAKLARAIEVNSLTVLRWEHGRSIPQNEHREALIRHLGLHWEDFLIAEKQPVSSSPIQTTEPGQQQPTSLAPIHSGELEAEQEQSSPATQPGESKREELSPPQTAQPVESRPEQPPSFLQLILPAKDEIKIYRGRRIFRRVGEGGITRHPYVTVNGSPLKYFGSDRRDPVEEIAFEWGYPGTGPQSLANSILADFFAEAYPDYGKASSRDYNALLYGSLFKEDFIAALPQDDDWEITSDQIREWFKALEEQGITREALLISLYGEKYYMKD